MPSNLKLILEALLMSHLEPLTCEQMLALFEPWERPALAELQSALDALTEDYNDRAIELVHGAGGYRLQTRVAYHSWIERLRTEKSNKYSQALLESLAIIAYQQPVTRADIEQIRGVAVSSSIIKTLLERGWISVAGYRDVPGKPAVYKTTVTFLDYFNLTCLEDLPPLAPIES